jgi:hypothetical protein
MTNAAPRGFFAYPSNPPTIGEAIRAAATSINGGGEIFIKPWEECSVGGKIIIQEICREIEQADLFCADLTHLNPNVMFELGYAIAINKRIWLVLDTSITDSHKTSSRCGY